MRKMRLDRLLSLGGYSRREAHELIRSGRVSVDGRAATTADAPVDADSGRVTLDGEPVRADEHVHLMLDKPEGVLTATCDKRDRTVYDLLSPFYRARGVGPVGRLDKDATGLVLLTDDGQLAHRLIAPKWDQPKKYLVIVEGCVKSGAIGRFREGVALADFTAKPAELTILEAGERSVCDVVVTEGKFHQVKRMLLAIGHPVIALRRLSIAGIQLDPSLGRGGYRELTPEEAASLYLATDLRGE